MVFKNDKSELRSGRAGRCLCLESLEDRRLLAGNVSAHTFWGSLYLRGDEAANGIVISFDQATPGIVTITGQNATTINNGLSAQTYQVRRDIHVQLKGGDDWFSLVGNSDGTTGDVNIDDDKGSNHISVNDLNINGSLRINTGDGSDEMRLAGLSVQKHLRIETGNGNDVVDLRSTTSNPFVVGRHTDIDMRGGEDELAIGLRGDVRFLQSLDVDMGRDSDRVIVGPGANLLHRFTLDGGRHGKPSDDTLAVPMAAAFDPHNPGRHNRVVGFEAVLTAPIGPSAIDDSLTVAADSVDNALDVLGNDLVGALGGDLRITHVGAPSGGGTVVITADQTQLTYTPLPGFFGTETWSYTIEDNHGLTASAAVTMFVPQPVHPLVQFRTEITDLAGNLISSIGVGQSFLLSVFVQDLRPNPRVVFSAYLDITHDASLASVSGPLQFNDVVYPAGQSGDTSTPGLIDEVGAIDGISPQPAPTGNLLFSLPFRAIALGQLTFVGNPADILPRHETTLFGAPMPVASDRMTFVGSTLQIINVNSAPTLELIPDVTLLAGAPLHVALNAFDADGDSIMFDAVSSNPGLVQAILSPNTNRSMRVDVADFGTMVFHLFEDLVPRVTSKIIDITNAGTYDGVIFHRVVKSDGQGNPFVIQGGDPNGNGQNDENAPEFDDQFHVDLQHTGAGLLSMAKAGDDTNTSQFFITAPTTVALRRLDFNHAVFGQLVEGESVRQAIQQVPTGAQDRPTTPVVMQNVEIILDQENGVLRLKAPEGSSGQATITVTARDARGALVTRTFQVTVQPDTFNGAPFLNDIPAITTTQDTPVSFEVSAQDAENSTVTFAHVTQGGTPLNGQYDPTLAFEVVRDDSFGDAFTTRFLVTPPAGFVGTLNLSVGVSSLGSDTVDTFDRQLVKILVA